MTQPEDPLVPSARDRSAQVARAILGLAPYIGSLLGELVTELIPGQRLDRLSAFVTELDKRLKHLAEDRLRERLASPEGIHLLEAATFHAARSASAERSAQFARVLSEGIKADTVDLYTTQHMLSLLAELNDVELIILKAFYLPFAEHSAFIEKHSALLRQRWPKDQASREARLHDAVLESYRDHLQRLGLTAPYFTRWSTSGPEFDRKTGTLKPHSVSITALGRALLAMIDVPDTVDAG